MAYNFYSYLLLVPLVPAAVILLVSLLTRPNKEPGPAIGVITLLVANIGLPVIYCFTPFLPFLWDVGAELRVQRVCGVKQLYDWGQETLRKPESQLKIEPHSSYRTDMIVLDRTGLPDFVRRINAGSHWFNQVYIWKEQASKRFVVVNIWGGRPHAFGVLICPPGVIPETNGRWRLRRWRPGVYGWQAVGEIY
jgi:hypothetical protein